MISEKFQSDPSKEEGHQDQFLQALSWAIWQSLAIAFLSKVTNSQSDNVDWLMLKTAGQLWK